jgi:hypothetical protein
MRQVILARTLTMVTAAPVNAVDFLGVELCADRVDTGVILPADSPLSLESAEVGRHGGLVLLLHSKKNQVLGQVDDLMESYVGGRGTGDERKLEWANDQMTAFAQVIQKGYVALAVTAAEGCTPEPEAAPASTAPETEPASPPESQTERSEVVDTAPAAAAAVAAETVNGAPPSEPAAAAPDFELAGRLKHAAAEDDWVDVMGVVVNRSGSSFAVASFDLSLYDAEGELICVDTVSVNQLRERQERAFRGSIRCADYVADDVASWKLQFAGGH